MAAEKRLAASDRTTDVAADKSRRLMEEPLSIEEKYDEVRQLINIGKEKGYLLYDEVNELLPSEITSSDELDDLFNTFGSAGIEVIDSDQKYLRDDKAIDRTAEGAEELELDLTPGALDKTNDPVRMYLREIDAVRKARAISEKLEQKLADTPRGATTRDKRRYRRCRWAAMRARVELSNAIRRIEFTEAVKRRLIDEMKDAVESVRAIQREIESHERQLNPKNKKQRLKEEERKNVLRQIKELRAKLKTTTDTLEQEPAELKQTLETIIR